MHTWRIGQSQSTTYFIWLSSWSCNELRILIMHWQCNATVDSDMLQLGSIFRNSSRARLDLARALYKKIRGRKKSLSPSLSFILYISTTDFAKLLPKQQQPTPQGRTTGTQWTVLLLGTCFWEDNAGPRKTCTHLFSTEKVSL